MRWTGCAGWAWWPSLVSVAFWTVTLAVAAGTGLAAWHLRAVDDVGRPPFAAGIAHGVVGAAGLALLLWALRGPVRGASAGVGSFGLFAAGLFGVALLTGVGLLFLKRKSSVMAIHASIAISGYVLLLAWNSLG